MRKAVRDAFIGFTVPLEGKVAYMYVDVKGLITAGIGNLADPVSLALSMPWQKDGRPATVAEIKADWTELKNADANGDYRKRHHRYAAPLTDVRLTDEGIEKLVLAKLDSNYEYLKKNHFPDLDNYSADAQLAILSIAWAAGPNWPRPTKGGFPKTKLAILAGDWDFAAREGKINATGNPGVVPRNLANERMFLNAGLVAKGVGDPDVLYWPGKPGEVCQCCGRPLG